MHIESEPLKYWIDNFYGYGSWKARVWFISHEDGGGDLPEDVAEKINFFLKNHGSERKPTLTDIRELYRNSSFRYEGPGAKVFDTLYDFRFGENAKLNTVWKNLISFVCGYHDEAVPEMLNFQQRLFVSSAQREALIKLYPLPSPNNHAWYYSWLNLPGFDFLKSRALYQEHLYPIRIKNILHQIETFKPELVVMYGMSNINTIKQNVQDHFPGASFKMIKAVKMKTPQHHRADFDGTTLVITTQIPALRHNRVETGFDWFEFGKMLRG